MAGKIDPSIYDERTTIGSSDDLDEYGVWVKSDPQNSERSLPDSSDGIAIGFQPISDEFDLPGFDETAASAGAAAFELEEITEYSEIPGEPGLTEGAKDGFMGIGMESQLLAPLDEFMAPYTHSGEEAAFGESLDFSAPAIYTETLPANPAAHAGFAKTDLSIQLLQRIADELSSIRTEITNLKDELSTVRSVLPEKEADAAGFFGEEEDEKIALTGDELHTILHTASFSEEAAIDISMTDDFNIALDLDTDPGIEIAFDPEMDIPELNTLREEGVMPVTPAPEDTSYLEEDPLLMDIESSSFLQESGGISLEESSPIEFPEGASEEALMDNASIGLDLLDDSFDNLSLEDPSSDFAAVLEETMEIPLFYSEESGEPVSTEAFFPAEAAAAEALFDMAVAESAEVPFDMAAAESGEVPFDMAAEVPAAEAAQTAFQDIVAAPPTEAVFPDAASNQGGNFPGHLRQEVITVLSYMDQLLESLPEEKIEEFARSEYFDTYKRLFEELGL